MKYFIKANVLRVHPTNLFGFPKHPLLQLIDFSILSNDGRLMTIESKEFNVNEAWNTKIIDIKELVSNDPLSNIDGPTANINYPIRNNILFPIFIRLKFKEIWGEDTNFDDTSSMYHATVDNVINNDLFTKYNFKKLLNKYGKTYTEIKNILSTIITPKEDNLFYGFDCRDDMSSITQIYKYENIFPGGQLPNCIDIRHLLLQRAMIANKNETFVIFNDYISKNYLNDISHPMQYNTRTMVIWMLQTCGELVGSAGATII